MLGQHVEIAAAGDEEPLHAAEEPPHVGPGQLLEGGAAGEMADVDGEVGVVDAGHRDAQQPAGGEPDQAQRAGSADQDLRVALALAMLEHLEQRRQRQRLRLVARDGEPGDRLEVAHLEVGRRVALAAGDGHQAAAAAARQPGQGADGLGHAVDVGQAVAALAGRLRGRGALAEEAEGGHLEQVRVLVLVGLQRHQVGRQRDGERRQLGGRRAQALREAAVAGVADETAHQGVGDLLAGAVGGVEGGAVGRLGAGGAGGGGAVARGRGQ